MLLINTRKELSECKRKTKYYHDEFMKLERVLQIKFGRNFIDEIEKLEDKFPQYR